MVELEFLEDRRFKNLRLAATSSLANINDDLQTKDVNSIKNSKPIIISIKKALEPEYLSKWLATLSFNPKEKEHNLDLPKKDSEKNLIHISQTEYPQIFHTHTQCVADDNSVFYPFKNFYIAPMDLSKLSNVKLQNDVNENWENDEESEMKSQPVRKIVNSGHSNEISQKRKNSKYANKYEKSVIKGTANDTVVCSTDSSNIQFEKVTQNLLEGEKKIQLENEISTRSRLGLNNNIHKDLVSKDLNYERNLKPEASNVNNADNTSEAPVTNPEESQIVSTKGIRFNSERGKRIQPVISGTLSPSHSLNLQISLTLTVNNDTYSLVPSQ
uniref:Uncharacterized protein n=1 Tax=Rhodnius prolixus TaxID=13249 RepID=T1HFL9_RHOPR